MVVIPVSPSVIVGGGGTFGERFVLPISGALIAAPAMDVINLRRSMLILSRLARKPREARFSDWRGRSGLPV